MPYIVWSVLYVAVNNFWTISLRHFVKLSLVDILNGEASFQLYFILITIQFYIIFPLFLAFINRVKHHPWIVLGISFLIQVVWLYWDYQTIQMGKIKLVGFWHLYEHYREHIIFSYEFYFILGAMVAIYFPQIRTFLLRHSKLVISVMLISLVVFITHYFIQVRIYHEPIGHANAVTQPLLAFYGVAMIFFLFMLASRWARNATKDKPPRGFKYWHALSDASFGVYLIQVFIMDFMLTWILPALPTYLPVPLRVIIGYLFTAGVTVLISLTLLRIPRLSRLVGRDYIPLRKAAPKSEPPMPPSLPDVPEQRSGQIAQTLS
jgi:membrane-bound acyltransferase YfiQ involved in biofilm formation